MAKRFIDRKTGRQVVMANVSKYHPDWGMTPAQHAVAKAERAAGKRPFVKKSKLRDTRNKLARSMGV